MPKTRFHENLVQNWKIGGDSLVAIRAVFNNVAREFLTYLVGKDAYLIHIGTVKMSRISVR